MKKEKIGFANAKVVKRVIERQICHLCWEKLNPDRLPVQIIDQLREATLCCECGFITRSGIYVRREVSLDEKGHIVVGE